LYYSAYTNKKINLLEGETVHKKLIINGLTAIFLLFWTVGNALASTSVTFGQLYTDNPLTAVKPIMPEIELVLGFVIAVFLISMVAGVFLSGSKAITAPLINSVEQRSKGIMGVITVAGVVFLVVISIAIAFELWNNYMPK
jgi:hypothetical protein